MSKKKKVEVIVNVPEIKDITKPFSNIYNFGKKTVKTSITTVSESLLKLSLIVGGKEINEKNGTSN